MVFIQTLLLLIIIFFYSQFSIYICAGFFLYIYKYTNKIPQELIFLSDSSEVEVLHLSLYDEHTIYIMCYIYFQKRAIVKNVLKWALIDNNVIIIHSA